MYKQNEVLTPFKARQYWKWLHNHWKQRADQIIEKVKEIEEEELRLLVAKIIEATAKSRGTYLLVRADMGFHFAELHLDDDVYDELKADEGALTDAFDWVVKLVDGLPAPFVRWALGPVDFMDGEAVDAEGNQMVAFESERVVYSVTSHMLVGMQSHAHAGDRKCKVIPIDFERYA